MRVFALFKGALTACICTVKVQPLLVDSMANRVFRFGTALFAMQA